MVTRADIYIYESDSQNKKRPSAILFRKADGYPEGKYGMMASLKPGMKVADVEALDEVELANEMDGTVDYRYCVYPSKVKVYYHDWSRVKI